MHTLLLINNRSEIMKIEKLLNKNRIHSTSYTPGGVKPPPFKEGQTICKLDANENQLKPSTIVIEAMKNELSDSYLYPFDQIDLLRDSLAKYHNFDKNNIVIGNGSTSLICAIADLFLNKGDEIVYSTPSYIAYSLLKSRYGIEEVITNNKNHASNIKAILGAISNKTKLVVIVNPNNPTGAVVSKEDLAFYIKNVPSHVVTIIDEAYIEFANKEVTQTMVPYIKNHKLIILRTFSKLYALAGMRIGYAITSNEIQEHLVKLEFNYAPTRLGALAARIALQDDNYIIASLKNNNEGKDYLTRELKSFGFDVIDSHTNFIYFTPNVDNNLLNDFLYNNGIIIRPFSNNALRVSIGLPYQNKLFIHYIKEFINQ